MPGDDNHGVILVVDDESANRELLRDLLEDRGFEVWEAADGQLALGMLESGELPDVILLDVTMPGLDGFEVCRRIRQDPETQHLPVLLVTARADRDSRLRGISEGATDYLTKPIDLVDTQMRVRNAIRTKRLYDQLAKKNRRLQEAEQARDNLVHMIVHDLKSPLTAVLGYCKLLLKGLAKQRLDEQQVDFLERSIASGRRTLDMVDSILTVSRLEDGQMELRRELTDIEKLVGELRASLDFATVDGLKLIFQVEEGLIVSCDPWLLQRVLSNLIDNAMRFADPEDGLVTLVASRRESSIEFSVSDNGKGIPSELRDTVFEKFTQEGQANRRNYGLGLAFCRLAVEAHGGHIWVEERAERGTLFRFTIPG